MLRRLGSAIFKGGCRLRGPLYPGSGIILLDRLLYALIVICIVVKGLCESAIAVAEVLPVCLKRCVVPVCGDDGDGDDVSLDILLEGNIYTAEVCLELCVLDAILCDAEEVADGLRSVALGSHL